MKKKIFPEKNSGKKQTASFEDLNGMSAEKLLGIGLKEREYSSGFQSFVNSFPDKVRQTLASAAFDEHNHGFMDSIIDAQVLCEKDTQANSETIARIGTAGHLAGRAQEIRKVLEQEIVHGEAQLENLKNKLDRTVLSYNKSTYEDEEDYEVFENIDDESAAVLKRSSGFGPAVTALILCCLCLADAVNLYTTFESISMLPFAVQIIMVVTSALLLQLLPFFCAKIIGELTGTCESRKKRKTAGKKVLAVVLITVFIALCSGLTAVRFQVLEEDSTSVSDISFSDTSQAAETTEEEQPSGSEKGYAIFLTILMITTSAASFYLGFEDLQAKEIYILNSRINSLGAEIYGKKAMAQRLEGYTKEYLMQLDEMQREAVLNHLVYEAVKMKIEARNILYEGKNPEEVSYIEDASAEIVEEVSHNDRTEM